MGKQNLFEQIEENRQELEELAIDIWNHPEVSHEEFYSSGRQKEYLASKGFTIKEIPNNPTSFVAEFGSGSPIIGICGEYDALPNLSQKACTHRDPVVSEDAPGHGCGHNLLGTAGVGAIIALKECLEKDQIKGTIRYYGCAAEETLAGKPLMAKEGVFDDLDACVSWHPTFMNTIWGCTFMAMNSLKFRFKGISAHASASPEAGRSALDAVEIMDIGANYLREHVPTDVRIHYAITNGGGLPNVVPADAEVWYYVRAPRRSAVRETTARLVKVAQGAATMTETTMEYELLAGCYNVLANHTIGDAMFKNMELIGAPEYDESDYQFAKELTSQLSESTRRGVMANYFAPECVAGMDLCDVIVKNEDYGQLMNSSLDIGDVSYITPTAQMTAAAWPVGVASHSWMSCASVGTPMGLKAMRFAAKGMAATVYDLLTDAELLEAAQEEFKQSTGGAAYISPFAE